MFYVPVFHIIYLIVYNNHKSIYVKIILTFLYINDIIKILFGGTIMKKEKFVLSGLVCDGCLERLSKALNRIKGMNRVEATMGSLECEFDENKVSTGRIIDTVNGLGYRAEIF